MMDETTLNATRNQAWLDTLKAQRNNACDYAADLHGEIAVLRAQLDAAHKRIAVLEAQPETP